MVHSSRDTLYIPDDWLMMMMIFWSNWWNEFGRGNRSTRRIPAPAPLYPPQNPTWRPGLEPRTAAVGSQRLMARPPFWGTTQYVRTGWWVDYLDLRGSKWQENGEIYIMRIIICVRQILLGWWNERGRIGWVYSTHREIAHKTKHLMRNLDVDGEVPTNGVSTLSWWWSLSAPETLTAMPAVA
jgi:hypothetical protein